MARIKAIKKIIKIKVIKKSIINKNLARALSLRDITIVFRQYN
jgi:hypothetical protein